MRVSACRRVGVWAYGRMGVWAYGRMGVWAYRRIGVLAYRRARREGERIRRFEARSAGKILA
jgi:hypothetical protein